MKKIVNNRIITYQITDNITIDIEHTMFKNDVVLVFWMRHVQYPVKGVMTIVNVKDVHPDVIINTGKRHPFNRELKDYMYEFLETYGLEPLKDTEEMPDNYPLGKVFVMHECQEKYFDEFGMLQKQLW